jgi:hypothetical protein
MIAVTDRCGGPKIPAGKGPTELTSRKIRVLLAAVAVVLLTAAYYRIQSASIITDAAKSFLASLTPEQRKQVMFDLKDEERMNWFYTPVPRKGLPMRDMGPGQRKLALALLSAGLSQRGMIKATTIMSLEDVLIRQEIGGSQWRRDPDGYFFSIFGQPFETGVWAFRVDGHHVSQNYTIVDGKVIDSPSFFGANPAEVKSGPRKGLRVLAREEDLARALVHALTPAQQATAIIDKTAPADILTENSRKAALNGQPAGLQVSAMNSKQKEMLQELLDEYCYNVPDPLAQAREDQIRKSGNRLWFAWLGGIERGEPHYYRIQSPAFLIEYDNTQDDTNHIHSVWRDFTGDFGLDLLAEHYRTSH